MPASSRRKATLVGISLAAAVLLSFYILSVQAMARQVGASDWMTLPTARLIDGAGLRLDSAGEDSAGQFFQAAEILGQERELIRQPNGFRLIWDGPDANPGRFDSTGLGGVDLTGGGLRDHFALRVGPSSHQVPFVLRVYGDGGAQAALEGWIAPALEERVVPLLFSEFKTGPGEASLLEQAGAMSLEFEGIQDPGWLRSLSADSTLLLSGRMTLVDDLDRNGLAGDGDIVQYELRVDNPGPYPHAGFRFPLSLPGRVFRLVSSDPAVEFSTPGDVPGLPVEQLPELLPGQGARLKVQAQIEQATLPAEVVLMEGDLPAGGGGKAVASVHLPFANGVGEVGFTGLLQDAGGDEGFVWQGDQISWRNSLSISPTLTGAEFFMGLGDSGEFIYSPLADGNDAVWTHEGLLAAEANPAPGFTPGTTLTFNSRSSMLPDGTAHWVAGFDDSGTLPLATQGRVFYRLGPVPTDTVQVVIRSDDVIGGYTVTRSSGVGFDYWVSQNQAHHVHELQLDTGSTVDDDFLYLDGLLVAREGSPTGEGDNWDNFGFPVVNGLGNYLLRGDTDGNPSSDAYLAYNGDLQLREGDVVAGVSLAAPATALAVGLNDLNQAAFAWEVQDGAAAYVFGACNAADLTGAHLLLATGDLVDLDGDLIGDTVVEDLNTLGPGLALTENGFVYLEVDLNDGSGGKESILKVPLNCGESPSVTLEKTAGQDPQICAPHQDLNVGPGSSVVYCYRVTNTGSITLTSHDLMDSELGMLLSDAPWLLPPGGSTFVTATSTLLTTTQNIATWIASSGYLTATDSASLTVTVEPFHLYLPVSQKTYTP